jgi:hypothetical protein
MTEIFTIIDSAKLTGSEAAEVFKINRATFYNWKNGGAHKNRFLFERAEAVANIIKRAVELKRLPLDPSLGPGERKVLIKEIINKTALEK